MRIHLDEGGFGFQVSMPDDTLRHVWVNRDQEGNGPGALEIEESSR